ncbi:MAG: hypothetical protein AAF694_17230, partial [Bacteroidota bacterium]
RCYVPYTLNPFSHKLNLTKSLLFLLSKHTLIRVLIVYGALLIHPSLLGQKPLLEDVYFRAEARKGVEYLYDMQFERASEVFLELEATYPQHPAPVFLQGLNRWWESYIAPEMDTYHGFILEKLTQAIELNEALADLPTFELEYTFFQYMSYAFKARLHTLRKEWLKAANAGRKAFPYLKKGFQFQERSPEFYFGSGIYHYYADEYPKTHPVIQPFMVFFPEASAEQGIAELRKASDIQNFAQFEAAYYLGDIYLKRGQLYPGLRLQERLYHKFPHNTWFRMEYGRALVDVGKYEKAEEILLQLVQAFEKQEGYLTRNIVSTQSHYTTYLMSRVYLWLGKGYVLQNKLAQAEQALDLGINMAKLSQLSTDDEYLPGLHFYLGMAYDHSGNRTQAVLHFKKVLSCSQNLLYKKRTKACLKEACTGS